MKSYDAVHSELRKKRALRGSPSTKRRVGHQGYETLQTTEELI